MIGVGAWVGGWSVWVEWVDGWVDGWVWWVREWVVVVSWVGWLDRAGPGAGQQ